MKVNFIRQISYAQWALAAVLPAAVISVDAQERTNRGSDEAETVLNRARPALDPTGIRTGGFFLFPTIDLELRNDDNIFADENDEDDTIFLINPAFSLRSNWNVHRLNVYGDVENANYNDFDDEDYTDYNLGAAGVLEVDSLRQFELGADIGRDHEDRGSADDVDGDEPTEFDRFNISALWRQDITRLGYALGLRYRDLDYDDVRGGLGSINNDDRDRDSVIFSAEVNYQISPDYRLFFRGESISTDYDDRFDDQGLERSSDGYSLLAGARLGFSGVTEGEVFVGRRENDYDDPQLNDVDGGVVGANITWNPTGLTTVKFLADRTIEETTSIDSAGYLRTSYGVSVDHELYRNFLLHGSIGAFDDEYEGIDRDDDHTYWRLGATYLANRSLRFYLTYDHLDRDSTFGDEFSYDRDRVSLRVRLMR